MGKNSLLKNFTALGFHPDDTDNEKLLMMMTAYILHTMPGVKSVNIDVTGDMNETDIIMEHESVRALGPIF